MNWYKLAQAEGVQSAVTTNKAGRQFFNIFGNTFPIKDQLGRNGLGFRYFQGTWGMAVDMITPEIRASLENIGVDTSPLDMTANEPVPVETAPQQPQQESEVPQLLGQMRSGVKKAIEEAKGNARAKAILKTIDDTIEELATMVDEAAAGEFVQNFMTFAAKFHKYSFGNQLLIWAQKPDATYVAGHKKWMEKFGRQVTNWENAIHIIGPTQRKHRITDQERASLPPNELKKLEEKSYLSFIGVTVFDISDTAPIQGWKRKTKEGVELSPFDPADIQQDSNETVEELEEMVKAAYDFGKSMQIDMDTEELGVGYGGYSAGGMVRINNTYQGINLFSTLVHELAHEILHWESKTERALLSKQVKEIDAESTAYIVLKHYGFTTKESPNYIALFRGSGKDVKARREAIQKAVTTIITGIDKNMKARMGSYEYYE